MHQLNTANTPPPNTKPVFCIDCRHMQKRPKDAPACAAPGARQTDLVTGYYPPRCDQARRPHQECGPFAILFEQLNTPDQAASRGGIASDTHPIASAMSPSAGTTR